MAGTSTVVVRLSDLTDGQEAECFAALVKKVRGTTSRDQPFVKCYFRDKRLTLEAPLWHDHRYHQAAIEWAEGIAYRLHVRGEMHARYGLQLNILNIRPAVDDDSADGYDFSDLFESSKYPADDLCSKIEFYIERYVQEPCLKQLVTQILKQHDGLFRKMPAAQTFHHTYNGGLLEHVWSLTRVCALLADHYERYYSELNPPLNKGIIVSAAILHDIGKLRELKYHPIETRYTKEGSLIGHVMMGRDLVRDTAREIPGFPEETLLLLEHAILAHHGKREFGAPVLPQTIEAMIVSFADDLDAKMNAAVSYRLRSTNDDEFTDRVFVLDNRRIYKGIPVELPADDDLADFA